VARRPISAITMSSSMRVNPLRFMPPASPPRVGRRPWSIILPDTLPDCKRRTRMKRRARLRPPLVPERERGASSLARDRGIDEALKPGVERPHRRHRQVLRPHPRDEIGPGIDPEEGRPVPRPAERARRPRHVGARIHAYGAAVAEP